MQLIPIVQRAGCRDGWVRVCITVRYEAPHRHLCPPREILLLLTS